MAITQLKKIKKIPQIAFNLVNKTLRQEFSTIYKFVNFSLIPYVLYARTRRIPTTLNLKRGMGQKEINAFLDLMQYHTHHIRNEFYHWEVDGKKFCATYDQFFGLHSEYLSGVFDTIYPYDWKNKRVIDIGGFIGDSALYFLEKGAKHVTIYEPVPINIEALHYNLNPFKGKFTIHQKALSHEEGWITIYSSFPEGNLGFGMEKGEHQMRCPSTTFQNVLENSQEIDVIKIDCEGSEENLVSLPDALIQKIPYWIIETHRKDIHQKILAKFISCGYKTTLDIPMSSTVNLIHFEKSIV